MKMFNFYFDKWFNLTTPELQDIISHMVAHKNHDELKKDLDIVRERLDAAQKILPVTEGANNYFRNLRVQNVLLQSAIHRKGKK